MTEQISLKNKEFFFNRTFDKGRLKNLISWYLTTFGEYRTIQLLEELKILGFHNATQAGISLSIDDLLIPDSKRILLRNAEINIQKNAQSYNRGDLTSMERFQYMIDTWHLTSENMKTEVVQHFRSTNTLNPVYMMAFSGARGNLSQVRQLVGMRGLMSDPQGEIINFPISSNFREGLTLTEYVISCYGARKGIVDTALRTANSGYLTRRLVDVAQHILISSLDCGTTNGITITSLKDGRKILLSLKDRLIGRVLAQNIDNIGAKNQIIDKKLASQIEENVESVLVRSPLTCNGRDSICQLCYGWSLAHNQMVSLGEAVGIIAAQSIGEPGTQLTMRTFHTGGVFSGDALDQIISPITGQLFYEEQYVGELIRTTHGKIAFLIKTPGQCKVYQSLNLKPYIISIPEFSILFIQNGEFVEKNDIIAEFASIPTQNNQRIQSKQSLIAPFDGQIFFEDVTLTFLESKNLDTIKTARDFGSLWVLKGDIKEAKIKDSVFPMNGDFIYANAPLVESHLVSSITGQIYLDSFVKKEQNKKTLTKKENLVNKQVFKTGLTSKQIGLPFSNLRWQSFLYSSTFKLDKYNLFSNFLLTFILNTGLSLNEKNTENRTQPIFGIRLKNLANCNRQLYFQNLQSSFFEIHFQEKFCIGKYFDVSHGLLSQKFPFSAKHLIFSYLFRNRIKGKALLTPKSFLQGDSENFNLQIFSILQEWVPKNFQLVANYNRQGQMKIQKTPFEGFVNLYFVKYDNRKGFLKSDYQKNSGFLVKQKPLLNKKHFKFQTSNFSIDSNTNNLLFSIQKYWPYRSKSIKNTPLTNTQKINYHKGQICIDDICFDSQSVVLQIKQKEHWQQHPSWIFGLKNVNTTNDIEFSNNNTTKELINSTIDTTNYESFQFDFPIDVNSNLTDLLTKLSIHLTQYPNTKTLWIKQSSLKTTTLLNKNSFIAISPLLDSNTFKKQKKFTKIVFNQFRNKNKWKVQSTTKMIETLMFNKTLFFSTSFLTIFKELIPNPQFQLQVPLQKQNISIEYSFRSFISIYKKLYGTNYYLPYIFTSITNQDQIKEFKTNSFISKFVWKQYSSTSIDLRIFNLFPFNVPLLDLPIINEKIKFSKKFPYRILQKNKTNQIVLEKEHNTYISKDQKIGKRQKLNRTTGEVIFVPKINLITKKGISTSDFNEKEIEKQLSEILFISKEHLICYDITYDYNNIKKSEIVILLGNFIRLEESLWKKKTISKAGQIVSIRKVNKKIILTIRKGQPFLFSSRAVFHTFHNDLVLKDNLLLTLFYRRLQTGDIVQGIPKIEEFFEARSSKFGEPLENSVPIKLKTLYENFVRRMPLQKAVRQSVQIIQKYLVDNVQQVYQSQGVTIADKHLEIIVRQMTSKVKILDGGQTGFLPGEFVNLDTIELINQGMDGSPATYEPILLGITKASLETKSFISAASFQETTRILSRAAIEKKTDFLKGLKENVILGHVIPAGTGFKDFLALKNLNDLNEE